MKVLHIHAGIHYGGIQRIIATLARYAGLTPGLEQEFALCFNGRLSRELDAFGARRHSLGPVRIRYIWQALRSRSALTAILRDGGHDAAVCHGSWALGVFGGAIQRAGVPLVYWMHNDTPERRKNLVETVAAKTRPCLVIGNSQFTASSIPLAFDRIPPSEVLPNPVDEPELAVPRAPLRKAVRRELGTDPDAVVILLAARPEAWKGHRLLMAALLRLADLGGWEAWIVGGAVNMEQAWLLAGLEREAADGGIANRVKFTGQRDDVPRIMAAADVFCQPNLSPEPFGIVFAEALYAGLPVVSANHGGAREIVDDSCGILVSPGSIEKLAAALRKLILRPDLRGRLAANAPGRARELTSPRRVIPRMEALFRRFVPRRSKRSGERSTPVSR
ncbi:MAG TPA: glycosyltransferase family 4 protein [Chthoniobacterales bacterium]